MITLTACTKPLELPAQSPLVPSHLLICPDEPKAPRVTTQKELVMFLEDVRGAGALCRANLRAVRGILITSE